MVLVVKFNDYQCPACAQTYRNYQHIFSKYRTSHPGAVKRVLKDYPLDPECNENALRGPHDAACAAAVAVRLARRNGQVERMEEWLFSNQQSLSPRACGPPRERWAVSRILRLNTSGRWSKSGRHRARQDVERDGHTDVRCQRRGDSRGARAAYFDAAIAYELERGKNP